MKAGARNVLLSVHATDGGAAQHSIEQVLDTYAKRWHRHHDPSTGSQALLYELRLKNSVSPDELASGVESAGGAHITSVQISPRANDL